MIELGLFIPFLGTALGSACVFFIKKGQQNALLSRAFSGLASGVMVAASIFSLLLPALESGLMPVMIGLWLGTIFLFVLDHIVPHLHANNKEEGPKNHLSRISKLVLAVTLHNIPEGMAVGVVFASVISGQMEMTILSAFALSIGIALQNFPEGAILSLPLLADGKSKPKAFLIGTLSGIVEPIASIITILLSQWIISLLPYFLSFAAGAMFYVVIEELVPEMAEGKHSNLPTICFMVGFSIMMILDVALG